jgi:putative FmdB family regulatory protein
MPLYEYLCEQGHKMTEIRSIHAPDPDEVRCPECETVMRQVVGSVGVAFKGSGFYSTDKRK